MNLWTCLRAGPFFDPYPSSHPVGRFRIRESAKVLPTRRAYFLIPRIDVRRTVVTARRAKDEKNYSRCNTSTRPQSSFTHVDTRECRYFNTASHSSGLTLKPALSPPQCVLR